MYSGRIGGLRSPNWDPLLQRIVPQRKVVQDACFVLDYRPLNVFAIFPKTIKIILFFNVKLLSDTFREQSVPAKPITKSWGYSIPGFYLPPWNCYFWCPCHTNKFWTSIYTRIYQYITKNDPIHLLWTVKCPWKHFFDHKTKATGSIPKTIWKTKWNFL